jgi:hypothetical protein
MTTCNLLETRQAEESIRRIAETLGMIIDKPIDVESIQVESVEQRVAGRGSIHISFKLAFQYKGKLTHGALLVPLADAITIGCYLMMMPDESVKSHRAQSTLGAGLKDALMEVGNFVGGASDAALRGIGLDGIKVRSEGCQGVKANVVPAFVHADKAPLVLGRARLRVHSWPPFEALLMLPALGPESSAA